MQFAQVIAKNSVKKHLIQTVQANRVSHAQLFVGKEGSGKLALAIAYAQYVLCHNKQETDSCGKCPSCIQAGKLAHPDLHFSFPVNTTADVKKDPISSLFLTHWREAITENPYMNLFQWLKLIGIENKQGNISAKDSQDVIKKLSLKSYEGGYKILIVWLPEKWHPTAANKLLKLIEEPPEKTLILLVAEDVEPILPTILSRAQMVKVPQLSLEEIKQGLINRLQVEEGEASKAAYMADGNYNEALSLITEQESAAELHNTFVTWLRLCYMANVPELLKWVEEFAKAGRENQKNMLRYGLQMFRECIIKNYSGDSLVHANDEEADFISKFAPLINEVNLEDFIKEFELAISHTERNANAKILFFDLSLKLTILLRKKPEAA